jgi:hypothetical protein
MGRLYTGPACRGKPDGLAGAVCSADGDFFVDSGRRRALATRAMRLLVSLVVALVAVSAHAARLTVHIPENVALEVKDATPPEPGTLRIDCPPTCVYDHPGSSVGIDPVALLGEP